MYSSLRIERLRGFRELFVHDLCRINLFVGRNNSGKSTVLEGVFLLGGAVNSETPSTLVQLRGQRIGGASPDAVWRPLFHRLDPTQAIRIEGTRHGEAGPRRLEIEAVSTSRFVEPPDSDEGGGTGFAWGGDEFVIGGLRLRYRPADGGEPVNVVASDPAGGGAEMPREKRADFVRTTLIASRGHSGHIRNANQFSYLLRTKREEHVLRAVRIVEPRLQRIAVLNETGMPAVYVDLGLDVLVPLAACGDGFQRLFSLAVELTAVRGGVLLIDEIDNGLHYSVLPALWKMLGEICTVGCIQIFATTHSDELLRSALEAFRDEPSVLGLFRIDRTDIGHTVAAYDPDSRRAVLDAHFEVRG